MSTNDDREHPMKRFERVLSRLLSDAADDGSLKRPAGPQHVSRARSNMTEDNAACLDDIVEATVSRHA